MALESKLKQFHSHDLSVICLSSKKSQLSPFLPIVYSSSIYITSISFSDFIKCFLRVSCMAVYTSEAVWWYTGKEGGILKARKT